MDCSPFFLDWSVFAFWHFGKVALKCVTFKMCFSEMYSERRSVIMCFGVPSDQLFTAFKPFLYENELQWSKLHCHLWVMLTPVAYDKNI